MTPPDGRLQLHSDWPDSLQWLLGIVTIAIFIVTFIVQAFQIPSESMENTLLIGDHLLVNKFGFAYHQGWMDRLLPYREIHRQTGVSVTTVGRVARYLAQGHGGYALAAQRVDGVQRESQHE